MENKTHKNYWKCLIRAAKKLEKGGIAIVDLENHVHPEFDFSSREPHIRYAQVRVSTNNPQLLRKFVSYANERLRGHAINSRLELWGDYKDEQAFNIQISPDESYPKDRWIEETEKVMCRLSPAIDNFIMENRL